MKAEKTRPMVEMYDEIERKRILDEAIDANEEATKAVVQRAGVNGETAKGAAEVLWSHLRESHDDADFDPDTIIVGEFRAALERKLSSLTGY